MRLGGVGIWSRELRFGDPSEATEAAAELEELGYHAWWIPGATGGALLDRVARTLEATRRVVVATGILKVWAHDAAEVAACGVRKFGSHAARLYSWMSPPRRSRRPTASGRGLLASSGLVAPGWVV